MAHHGRVPLPAVFLAAIVSSANAQSSDWAYVAGPTFDATAIDAFGGTKLCAPASWTVENSGHPQEAGAWYRATVDRAELIDAVLGATCDWAAIPVDDPDALMRASSLGLADPFGVPGN